jgi:hypothetical protein
MEARKFSVGDRVRVRLDSYTNESPAGVYTVSRALPVMANSWQYRVKRAEDGQERAVSEQQLAKADMQGLLSRSMAEAQHEMQRFRGALRLPRKGNRAAEPVEP